MNELHKEFALTEEDFNFLGVFIHDRTGIVINDSKKDLLYSRIARRLRTLGLANFSQYCNLLRSEAIDTEIEHLINSITTNLTGFFRENHHFDHLAGALAKLKEKQVKKIRIWSSACSSGQEPYSTAMVVDSTMKNLSGLDIRILATDIDSDMLNKSRAGIYASDDLKGLPAGFQERYFHKHGDHSYQVSDYIKNLIQFNKLNLLEEWPMRGQFDMIFCRNVVIYFDKETQKRMFSKMYDYLVDGGYLYIGHAENLSQLTNHFKLVGRTTYQKI